MRAHLDPISAIGVALTTASVFLLLVLIAPEVPGVLQNPYAGIVVFVIAFVTVASCVTRFE